MEILHALADQGAINLWAEADKVQVKGRKAAVPWHPCALGGSELRQSLSAAGLAQPGQPAEVTIRCPATDKLPLPSHPVLGAVSGQIALRPWRCAAWRYAPEKMIDWLLGLPERELLAPGLMLGRDLLYLRQVLQLALQAVAAGQFLPGLSQGSERAVWKPVLSAPQRLQLMQWASAMPAALRAGHDVPPAKLLNGLLAVWTDALVRRRLPPAPGQGGNAYDAWVQALYQVDGLAPVPRRSNRQDRDDRTAAWTSLAGSLTQWERPVQLLAKSPFRLCLQLSEPDQTEGPAAPWTLEAQLQAFKDPSLRIPLAPAWEGRPEVLRQLQAGAPALKEYLLTAMGQACALFAPLQGLLESRPPGRLVLDTAQVWQFLATAAPALEQAGFGLWLPAWWTRPRARALSLRAAVKASGTARLNLASLLRIDWHAALDGERLSLDELRELAALKLPLVFFRGQWRLVDAEALQQALDFLRRQPRELSLRELLPVALGSRETPFAVDRIEAKGKLKDLLDQLLGHKPFALCELPKGFQGSLRPYQERGWSWLDFLHTWGLGACLADDMGLGKTPQTLTRILAARLAEPKAAPVLLICPTTLVGNWLKEAAKFTPKLKVHVHHGAARNKEKAFRKAIQGKDLVISSYGLLQRDIDFLQVIDWQGVVLDEAQNIKNPETQQARAARALPAQWRIALTGTPLENHVGDLWSLMEFLNPGLLGPYARFKRLYQQPIQQNRDMDALAALKQRIGPFMLRRLKTDKSIIDDLPDKLEMDAYCPLTREQASLYQAQLDYMLDALQDSDGIRRKGLVLSSLLRFKQLCDHPALFQGEDGPLPGRSGKLQRLEEMLAEVREAGEAALIFSQFAEMGALLRSHLQNHFGEEVLLLTGETPKRQRDEMVERFQTANGPGIFILSLKAGGTGLNLTRANHVCHFDRWWNPAVENQATDRAFRIGQRKNVQVHKFICAGTVEDRIAEMLAHKSELAGLTVGSGEAWLTELSNQQLHDLFRLDLAQAVSE